MKHLHVYIFFGVPITIAICIYIYFLGNITSILLAGAGIFLLNLFGKRLKSSTVTAVLSNVEKDRLKNKIEKSNIIKDYTEILANNLEWSTKQQLQAARDHLAIQKAVWDQELLMRKKSFNSSVEEKIESTRRKESEWTNHQIEKADYELAQLQKKKQKEMDDKRANVNKILQKRKNELEDTKMRCKEDIDQLEQSAKSFRRGFARTERFKKGLKNLM